MAKSGVIITMSVDESTRGETATLVGVVKVATELPLLDSKI
jgi:hypothetical protein